MIMGIGGHWIYELRGRHNVCICNPRRNIPFIEGSDSAVAYTKTALYLAKRINCDRLMLSYARKKGRSINSKKGRKPRMTYIDFDGNYRPASVTLGRCASRRVLDGVPFRKRFKPAK